MDSAKLESIHIPSHQRKRSHGAFWMILFVIVGITGSAFYFANPWAKDPRDAANERKTEKSGALVPSDSKTPASPPATAPAPGPEVKKGEAVLTVSGYIINRERIERSPLKMNEVRSIKVKKGDRVEKDQIIVQLDDAEERARLAELDGQLAMARVALERAKLTYARVKKLRATQSESEEREDETRLAVATAEAQIEQLNGTRAIAQVYLDRTVIRSPITGVVLERLADPGELVTPQSFGGSTGPSTALVALGDPNDLQVETDVSERDLAKIKLEQRCRVSPEAYPDKIYNGRVVEIAPEANRQKGTLQIKVQIEKPDRFLIPELSAKVEFLKE